MGIHFLLPLRRASAIKAGLFVFFSALSALLHAQQCRESLRGQVRQSGSHEPLAYASLFIRETGARILSDATGNYVFENLCEHRAYRVEVSYLSQVFGVEAVPGKEPWVIDFPENHALESVVITGDAAPAVHTEVACTVDELDFLNKQAMSLGEIVRQLPGVSALQTGGNISKPVIQGLHSNRVAIVSDNVILESQQWGREHAPEIDPFSSEKVTVVKGALGVKYGVGAMAGAVVLQPAPLRPQKGWGGWMTTGGFSNGRSGVLAGALDFRTPSERWGFRLQGAVKRGGNLRAPDYWLYNSGHAEFNFSAAAEWKQNDRNRHEVSLSSIDQKFAILKSSHLGNIDQITTAAQLDTPLNNINRFTYAIGRPYQAIRHYTAKYRWEHRINDYWQWTTQYSYQFNDRDEYDIVRKTGQAADRPQASFRLFTNVLDIGLENRARRYWQGAGGVQVIHYQNYTNPGAFIPNYLTLGMAAWATERWRKHGHPWEWEIGARYDYRRSHVYTEGNYGRDINRNVQFGNISGVTGVHYHWNEALTLTFHSGYAWRPPSVYELFAKGVHHGAGTYEEGDSTLVSEKAWNSSLTFSLAPEKHPGLRVSMTVYRNFIRDFIYLDPQNTVRITVRGPFPAYYYQQADAILQGVDLQADLPLQYGLVLETRAAIIRAWRKLEQPQPETGKLSDPLPLIPADRLQYGLKWTTTDGRTSLRVLGNTVLKQYRFPAEGLLKDPPDAFTTFSLDASHGFTWLKKQWEFGVGIQNLTNTRYREYLNFFRFYADEPGFNLGLRLKIVF